MRLYFVTQPSEPCTCERFEKCLVLNLFIYIDTPSTHPVRLILHQWYNITVLEGLYLHVLQLKC